MAKAPVGKTKDTAKPATARTRKPRSQVRRGTAKHNPDQQDMLEKKLGSSMAETYPQYYKDMSTEVEMDVYLVHHKFNVDDPSGALHHASKKILLSGVRTGGKSKYKDIKESRDTLTRWLEINRDMDNEPK